MPAARGSTQRRQAGCTVRPLGTALASHGRAGVAAAVVLAWAAAGAGAATLQVEVLGSNGRPLPGAAVFLESREAQAAARPAQGVEIEQASKQFQPMMTIVPVGTVVRFPNRDTVRHHVYSFSPAKTFELKLYTGSEASPVTFDKAGIAVLGCNIHDQMAAWVVVVDTPYFGRSPAGGRLSLDNVPPGSYRLRVWHPDLPVGAPALDQALALPASGGSATVRVPVAAP